MLGHVPVELETNDLCQDADDWLKSKDDNANHKLRSNIWVPSCTEVTVSPSQGEAFVPECVSIVYREVSLKQDRHDASVEKQTKEKGEAHKYSFICSEIHSNDGYEVLGPVNEKGVNDEDHQTADDSIVVHKALSK